MTIISTSPRKSILGRFPHILQHATLRFFLVVLASIGVIHLVNSILPITDHAENSATFKARHGLDSGQLLLASSPHVPVVRVYMYEMPPEFNIGLLSIYWSTSHGKGGSGERASRKRGRKRRSGDSNRRRLLQSPEDANSSSSSITDAIPASIDASSSGKQNDVHELDHHKAVLDYPRHQHSAEWFLYDFLRNLPLSSSLSSSHSSYSTPQTRFHDADDMLESAVGADSRLALGSITDVAAARLSREAVAASSVHVLRVANHSDADLVYVPIFSSLLLKVAQVTGRRNVSEADLERRAVEWVRAQPAWQATRGRNHVWPATHPRALTTAALPMLTDASEGALPPVLLVSDFGRVEGGGRGGNANVVKDVVMPYVHRVEPFWEEGEGEGHERPTLLYFRGNIHRKAAGHVRESLFTLLSSLPSVVMEEGSQTSSGVHAAQAGMRAAKFCLHPAGDTPSSGRLFDAIVSGCVPVVVSDVLDLPFEDVLEYDQFCVFVDSEKAIQPGHLLSVLEQQLSSGAWDRKHDMLSRVRPLFVFELPSTSQPQSHLPASDQSHDQDTDDPIGGGSSPAVSLPASAAALAVPAIWRKLATKVPAVSEEVHRMHRRTHDGFGPCTCGCTYSPHGSSA